MTTKTDTDPIQTTILGKKLEAVTKEMGISLVRTTSSSFFQARDMCTGILDANGRTLCQAEYLALLAYSLGPMVKSTLHNFEGDINPGDVFIHNDPFQGCNQLQDLGFLRPVFWENELVYWTGAKGHILDLGGPVMGGYNPGAHEYWEETIRIPPTKVWDRGRFRSDVWNLLLANTRLPDYVNRDFRAMVGGCLVGEQRILELIAQYGLEGLRATIEALLDATERWMRQEISAIPDGNYHAESTVYHNGLDPKAEHTARLNLEVAGEEMKFDFSESDPQSPGFINGVYATTYAALAAVLFMCVDSTMPHNDGAMRPIIVVLPPGSFLNASYPAATVRGNLTCNDVISECIIECLADVIPQRMFAAWHRPLIPGLSGIDPRSNRMYYDVTFLPFGGAGAAAGADGWSYQSLITATGLRIQDYELQEVQSPHLILEHEYRVDGGGPGLWRGGTGVHARYQTYAKDALAVTRGTDGFEPFGILGGGSGASAHIRFELPDGSHIDAESNAVYHLPTGTIIDVVSCGGGGYGHPADRPATQVRLDVREGVVSIGAAESAYGVALLPDSLEIDEDKTMRLRDELRNSS